MIARAKPRRRKSRARKNTEQFLALLPLIHEQARHAFRTERPERREELIAEVTANCWVAFIRLVDRGLDAVIYATPLARYAIKQVRDGRRVGNSLNIQDVSSKYAQRRKDFVMERLDCYSQNKGEWNEILVEDRHAGPAETAASRIDFAEWLLTLPRRKRRIAEELATGETTRKTAKRFRVSAGRISQMRRELKDAWEDFQGRTRMLASA